MDTPNIPNEKKTDDADPAYSAVAQGSSSEISSQPPDGKFKRLIWKIENYFELRQRGSGWLTELRAGCVTFVTMAYILAVNASIISVTGGPCQLPSEGATDDEFFACQEIVRLDLITATAVGALIACLCMGLTANMPIGMAPGMGINAYFTYSVVGPWFEPKKVNYQTALCAVFIEGWIFIILSITGIRIYIAKLIPPHLKSAITAGMTIYFIFMSPLWKIADRSLN